MPPVVVRPMALIAIAAVMVAPAWGGPAVLPAAQSSWHTDIPPRLQWNANFGYCGEVSLISAGLYFGQYVSQYDARAIASNGAPQYLSGSQLLLGVNDQTAAAAMHLNALAWDESEGSGSQAFLAWVKQ